MKSAYDVQERDHRPRIELCSGGLQVRRNVLVPVAARFPVKHIADIAKAPSVAGASSVGDWPPSTRDTKNASAGSLLHVLLRAPYD
jgi:hypothetical protein